MPPHKLVGLDGLEPSTSRLSGVRSNQLSYRPACCPIFSSLKTEQRVRYGRDCSRVYRNKHWRGFRQCHLPGLHRKEVIQPHLPIRLPCYDFTPIIGPTFDGWLLAVTPPASGVADFRGVTGGVYKARERIHRSLLICDY